MKHSEPDGMSEWILKAAKWHTCSLQCWRRLTLTFQKNYMIEQYLSTKESIDGVALPEKAYKMLGIGIFDMGYNLWDL